MKLEKVILIWDKKLLEYSRNDFRQMLLNIAIKTCMDHNFAQAFAQCFENGEIFLED